MCDACQAEYEDPLDRRFHAQPNACPVCGPQVRLLERDGTPVEGDDDPCAPPRRTCSTARSSPSRASAATTSPAAPTTRRRSRALRARKHREDRPFALLVADVDAARALVELDDAEEALLTLARAADRARAPPARRDGRGVGRAARARPRAHAALHAAAPAARDRHRRAARADERQRLRRADRLRRRRRASSGCARSPTASSSTTARSRRAPTTRSCASCASARCCCAARAATSRRASTCRSRRRAHVLGTGAEQKNAFCVAKGDRAWAEPPHRRHQELRDAAVAAGRRRALRGALRGHARGRRPRPAPRLPLDALRARSARTSSCVAVQHHHAHLAATLAEHGETGPAVGAIFDGTGYGTDGTVWGGEILVGGLDELRARRAPRGRSACPAASARSREPWRMACRG